MMRLLATPDPFLGSEVPLTETPEVSLLDQKTRRVVVDHLPVHSEGEAGVFGIAEYEFPRGGSFLLHLVIHADDGESLAEDFPITVQANVAGFFRFWVNLAVAILILGLTAMQLWKVRVRGGELAQMVRPAAVGLVLLVVVVLAMDRVVLGWVLDLRKPPAVAPAEETVTTNEDGSYTIPATIQKELGLKLVDAKEMLLGQTVTAYGIVESRPDLTAIVQAPLWGRLEWAEKPLAVGDRVKKGQQLVQVVLELNALERGLMEQKDVDLKGAKKRAEDRRNAARFEYDRIQALRANNPVYEADEAWAKQLFDQATADYDEIVKQDTSYQAVMKWRDPRRTPVASPMDGVLTTVDFVPGELNVTDEYRNLFTIVDLNAVWVRAQVVLADVTKLKDGDSVRVYPATSGSKPVLGRIRWIGDTIDPANRTAPVLVDVANEGHVFALGSFARLEFVQPRTVLAVPEEAVVDEGTSRWVYVARQEGTFAPVKVEMGLKQGGWWQVTAGLVDGDQVIAKGAALLGSMPHLEEAMLELAPSASVPEASTYMHEGPTPQQH
ncbi:MAG: efflux RND transporter periplasmic adaptor subunit [Acidobacteria bacterium]|nr:efflux RND transporter periplasmic adaptor subunit [Acidobacteriota bacterium]